MSRTNSHRPYERWNLVKEQESVVLWGSRRGEIEVDVDRIGNETWDLRYFAGCRRRPQLVHRRFDTWGYYCTQAAIEPGVRSAAAKVRQRLLRATERAYLQWAKGLWNAGDDWAVEGLLEPPTRPYSTKWDLW